MLLNTDWALYNAMKFTRTQGSQSAGRVSPGHSPGFQLHNRLFLRMTIIKILPSACFGPIKAHFCSVPGEVAFRSVLAPRKTPPRSIESLYAFDPLLTFILVVILPTSHPFPRYGAAQADRF